ncbi:hypothetical protein SAMN02745134_01252 [Clostridium acidisoli DSM 12555]|uniref:Uncharacterized protein n=1 Tax=Clostridium acidisoli DSM 12555 TaxID=1121291 RepID=A0A1W1XBM3_9CLOT|nr:hypothetical protein [Clostridium acidisoli]SMC21346.1 hypothetical protein SAMN02745134_01252 [Clostridium acidisoli DSM 12555]
MKKLCGFMGKFFLGMVALISIVEPASLSGVATEKMPKSIEKDR